MPCAVMCRRTGACVSVYAAALLIDGEAGKGRRSGRHAAQEPEGTRPLRVRVMVRWGLQVALALYLCPCVPCLWPKRRNLVVDAWYAPAPPLQPALVLRTNGLAEESGNPCATSPRPPLRPGHPHMTPRHMSLAGHMTPRHMSFSGHMTPKRMSVAVSRTPGHMSFAGHMTSECITPGHMNPGHT